MSKELKCCPFCGAEAKVKVSWRNEDVYVECRNCYSRTDGFGLEELAIEQWNTRKPIDKVVAELEEKSDDIPVQYEENYDKGFDDGIWYAIDTVKRGDVE